MSSVGIEDHKFATLVDSLEIKDSCVRRRFDALVTAVEIAADAITVMLAIASSYLVYSSAGLGRHIRYDLQHVILAAVSFSVVFVLLLDRDGAYQVGSSLLRIKETERILRVSVITLSLVFALTFFFAALLSRWMVALAFVLVVSFLIVEKQLIFIGIRHLHARGYGVKRTVIYGAGFTGRRVLSLLAQSLKVGLAPVAVIDDNPALAHRVVYEHSYTRNRAIPVIPGPVTEELLRRIGAEMLVVAIPSLSQEKFGRALNAAVAAGIRFSFIPTQAMASDLWIDCTEIDGLLLSSLAQPVPKRLYEFSKRVFDFVGAGVLLLFFSLPLALIALMVRIDSPGPALFRQRRVGRYGRQFRMYKFRTMYTHLSVDTFSPQHPDDPRITSLGKFLRRTSLDEVPQLINVLKGEMSLVGPRPEMPFIVAGYNLRQRQRLEAMPGITGLWQLSADRAFLIHENIQYDLYYLRNRNFFMDLAVLLHTLVFAMKGI